LKFDLWTLGAELARRSQPFCFCTVIASSGSVPRRAGSAMIVMHNGTTHGTLGGGIVERRALDEAIRLLHDGGCGTREFNLNDPGGDDTGAVCGGTITIYFDVFRPDRTAHVFGAGHVALPTVCLLSTIGYAVKVYDDSPAHASAERFPDAAGIEIGDPAQLAARLELACDDVVIILTASHVTDYAVVRTFKDRLPAYLGVIGSKAKSAHYREQLLAEGWSPHDIARIHSPIGLAIGARTPEEIAVAIAAELIQWRGQSE
jgi:xanthine dehydrogenase accessory factor